MRRNGKRQLVLLSAYNKGFRMSPAGELITPDGKPRAIKCYNGGYPSFNYGYDGVRFHVFLHRLQGYQKFNWLIFVKGLLVRHENNNKMDPSYDNLLLGTEKINYHDNPPELIEKMQSNLKRIQNQDLQDEIGF